MGSDVKVLEGTEQQKIFFDSIAENKYVPVEEPELEISAEYSKHVW